MAKKDKNKEIVLTPDSDYQAVDEPLFEAEAYANPEPEEGSDVTVMKPVGMGGPVPIVAPKHNTIQLQPIIVPLAVVPYMTQDSNVLRTDGRGQDSYAPATVEYGEATDFETVSAQKVRKRSKVQPRIFALVTFLLSALVVLPFILSNFVQNIGSMGIAEFNIIGTIQNWVANGFALRPIKNLAYIGVAGVSAIMVLSSLVSMIVGKYPRAMHIIFSLAAFLAMLALLIKWLVKKEFVIANKVGFVVILALAFVNFLLVVVFSCLLNKLEDKVEKSQNAAKEI